MSLLYLSFKDLVEVVESFGVCCTEGIRLAWGFCSTVGVCRTGGELSWAWWSIVSRSSDVGRLHYAPNSRFCQSRWCGGGRRRGAGVFELELLFTCRSIKQLCSLYKIIASNSKFHRKLWLTFDVLVRARCPTFVVEWMGTGTNRAPPQ